MACAVAKAYSYTLATCSASKVMHIGMNNGKSKYNVLHRMGVTRQETHSKPYHKIFGSSYLRWIKVAMMFLQIWWYYRIKNHILFLPTNGANGYSMIPCRDMD